MATMKAVLTTGNGGYDKLEYTDVPRPVPSEDQVLLQVLAAGCNNTEINTRLGWYSKTVKKATNDEQAGTAGELKEDGGWSGKTPFPFIQGTDCCGIVVEAGPGVGAGVSERLMGQRCMVRPCQRTEGFDSFNSVWMGSDHNGAFAQYVLARAGEVFPVDCDWKDEELGSIPCAYGTAENMLIKASVKAGDRVLVPGASGGVGSAVVQLCKVRGAHVTALCGRGKAEQVRGVGADVVEEGRHGDEGWAALMGRLKGTVDVVVDNVGGPGFPDLIDCMARGGRYVTSGAISGPIVELDLRTLYLMDLRLLGSTLWEEDTMPNLVRYIEAGSIRPLVSKTFPLDRIVDAQEELLQRKHIGKLVLIPPKP